MRLDVVNLGGHIFVFVVEVSGADYFQHTFEQVFGDARYNGRENSYIAMFEDFYFLVS